MPFGGVKASGWGRFGGRAALEEFTELRWITIQETAAPLPDLSHRRRSDHPPQLSYSCWSTARVTSV